MFEKPLMLTGLKKQYRLLGELMDMADKNCLLAHETEELMQKTRLAASNLRRLRRIRRTYGVYLNGERDAARHAGDQVRMLAEQ